MFYTGQLHFLTELCWRPNVKLDFTFWLNLVLGSATDSDRKWSQPLFSCVLW